MLASTYDYLRALREGNYLLFLDWPQFILEYYSDEGKLPDADVLLNLLVFEWLNNGYCEEDAKQLAILFAVSDLESRPIKGYLSYALSSIGGAVFQCMLYSSVQLNTQFLVQKKLTLQEVNRLMNASVIGLNQKACDEVLYKQQTIFFTWIDAVSPIEINKAYQQISPIADLRYLIEEYIIALEISKLPEDQLKGSRLSVIKRLGRYLNEQTELTLQVKQEIALYITKIREMKIADFENKYLQNLPMPTSKNSTWAVITTMGMSFFNLLQLDNSLLTETKPFIANESKI